MTKRSDIQYRAFKNTVTGFISFLLSFIQTFVAVPILLKYWGNHTYGIWLSLIAGFTLLQALDLGHQNYVGNKFNLLFHTDKEKLKEAMSSSLIIALILGCSEFIIAVILIIYSLLGNILGISNQEVVVNNLGLSLLILMTMWIIFGSAGGILVRLLIPAGMFYESQWFGIVLRFTQFLSLIIVVALGGNIFAVCIFYALAHAVISVIVFFYIKRKLPEFFPWWRGGNLKTAYRNFRNSLVLTLNNLAQQFSHNGLIIFVSNFFMASLVPVFTTIRTVTNTAGSITNIFVAPLIPDIARFHAKGEAKKLIVAQHANWFISGSIVNLGIALILPFIETLYNIWTNGYLEFNFPLFLFLAASISFFNFGSGLYTYLVSINNLFSQSITTFIRTISIFTVSYVFLDLLGLTSIGLGILFSEIICSAIFPVYFVNIQLKNFDSRLNLKFIILALLPPIIFTFISFLYLTGFRNILLLSLVTLSFILLVYFLNWFKLDSEVKRMLKDMLKNSYLYRIKETYSNRSL